MQGDVSLVPRAFNTARHADAVAAVDLSEMGFGGKGARAVGSGLFIAKLVVQLMAHKLLPAVVPKPALMTLNDTTTGCAFCSAACGG